MKSIILTLLIMASILGCNSDDEQQFNLDVGIEFSIKNSEGIDLLNPNNSESLNESEIKLFYLINGNVEEVFDPNMDSPRNFLIYKHESEYRIGISQNYSETEEFPITYIQWNNQDTDTLKCEYARTNRSIRQQKIWLNDELIWDASTNTEPFYEIIKE